MSEVGFEQYLTGGSAYTFLKPRDGVHERKSIFFHAHHNTSSYEGHELRRMCHRLTKSLLNRPLEVRREQGVLSKKGAESVDISTIWPYCAAKLAPKLTNQTQAETGINAAKLANWPSSSSTICHRDGCELSLSTVRPQCALRSIANDCFLYTRPISSIGLV